MEIVIKCSTEDMYSMGVLSAYTNDISYYKTAKVFSINVIGVQKFFFLVGITHECSTDDIGWTLDLKEVVTVKLPTKEQLAAEALVKSAEETLKKAQESLDKIKEKK